MVLENKSTFQSVIYDLAGRSKGIQSESDLNFSLMWNNNQTSDLTKDIT